MATSRDADSVDRLRLLALSGQISRRQLLRRATMLGLSAPVIAALLAACGGDDEAEPTSAAVAAGATTQVQRTPDSGAARQGGTLIAGWEEDAAGTLDPPATLGAHENRLTNQYADTLWSLFGDSTELQPALAERWSSSEDGLTWDVTLKPNLKFQDGTACDAEAVRWSFDRWLNTSHPFYDGPYGLLSYFLGALQGVEKTGDLSLRFSLNKKDSMFASNMLVQWAAVVSPTALQEKGLEAFGQQPVCSGPWKVAEREKGVRIVFQRNEQYWKGAPLLDELIVKPIVENAQRLNQLQTGDVDLVVAMSPEFIPQIEADSNLQLLQAPAMHIWWVALNMHEEPMKKKEVRQALNYAINKDAIVSQILRGAAVVTPGPMLPDTWAADPSIKPYPYDPQKAKELLTAAGYPDGFTTKFWVPESGSGMIAPKEIAQVIQANLKEVGVNAEIVTQEWTSYLHDWGANGFDKDGKPLYGMAEMSWNFATPDPGFWLNPNLKSDSQPPAAFNAGFYSNPTVDDLLDQANASFDQDERARLFKQVQQILWDDCPWIFTFSANNVAAATKRLKGVVLSPNPWILRLDTAYFES